MYGDKRDSATKAFYYGKAPYTVVVVALFKANRVGTKEKRFQALTMDRLKKTF